MIVRDVVLGFWAVGAFALLGCELRTVLGSRRVAGFGAVLDRLTGSRLRTVSFFVGWMWLGWHCFAR